MGRYSTTRRSEAMVARLEALRRDAAWLIDHVGELDCIAHSNRHADAEQVRTGHQASTESPDLSVLWNSRLRTNLSAAEKALRRISLEVTAIRVGLEQSYGGPGADNELIGTELLPGELERLRKAKAVRDANQGDCRFGEWEAMPDRQPGQQFKGRAS